MPLYWWFTGGGQDKIKTDYPFVAVGNFSHHIIPDGGQFPKPACGLFTFLSTCLIIPLSVSVEFASEKPDTTVCVPI